MSQEKSLQELECLCDSLQRDVELLRLQLIASRSETMDINRESLAMLNSEYSCRLNSAIFIPPGSIEVPKAAGGGEYKIFIDDIIKENIDLRNRLQINEKEKNELVASLSRICKNYAKLKISKERLCTVDPPQPMCLDPDTKLEASVCISQNKKYLNKSLIKDRRPSVRNYNVKDC